MIKKILCMVCLAGSFVFATESDVRDQTPFSAPAVTRLRNNTQLELLSKKEAPLKKTVKQQTFDSSDRQSMDTFDTYGLNIISPVNSGKTSPNLETNIIFDYSLTTGPMKSAKSKRLAEELLMATVQGAETIGIICKRFGDDGEQADKLKEMNLICSRMYPAVQIRPEIVVSSNTALADELVASIFKHIDALKLRKKRGEKCLPMIVVGIDEAQLLTPFQNSSLVSVQNTIEATVLSNEGKKIDFPIKIVFMVAALNYDYRLEPFPMTSFLQIKIPKQTPATSICLACGGEALYSGMLCRSLQNSTLSDCWAKEGGLTRELILKLLGEGVLETRANVSKEAQITATYEPLCPVCFAYGCLRAAIKAANKSSLVQHRNEREALIAKQFSAEQCFKILCSRHNNLVPNLCESFRLNDPSITKYIMTMANGKK